jgi:hypothetical protein
MEDQAVGPSQDAVEVHRFDRVCTHPFFTDISRLFLPFITEQAIRKG